MAAWRPCKRRVFVRRLRRLGFEGPYAGTRHEFLVIGQHRLAIPSNAEYSLGQLRMLLREVAALTGCSLSADDWEALE